jgi:hypothetical protein
MRRMSKKLLVLLCAAAAPACGASAGLSALQTIAQNTTTMVRGSGELPDPNGPMPASSIGTNGHLGSGQPASVKVDARADIYSAGMSVADQGRGGVLPSALALAAGGGVVTFSNVHGKTGCQSDTPAADADGGGCAGGNTDLQPAGTISGIVDHNHSQFLVGLFLAGAPGKLPPRMDFTGRESFHELSPQLGQTFFIGDGLTGTGSGDVQRFVIPAGASTLYLGIADGSGFQGAPGMYGDNTGGIAVTATQGK